MKKIAFIIAFALFLLYLLAVIVIPLADAEPQAEKAEAALVKKTFKAVPADIAAETQKTLIITNKEGFAIEAGGDTFKAYIALDKVRYEYQGESYEWQPLDHQATNVLYQDNAATLRDFWTDTDMRLTVRDYGVKHDIILQSDKAPRSFSFRLARSAGWEDEWIREAFAYDATPLGESVSVKTTLDGDVLTYTLPADLSDYEFPITLDPTFELGNSVDDTYSMISSHPFDLNNYTANSASFGRYDSTYYRNHNGFVRFALNIPRGSKIIEAKLHMKSRATYTLSFNTTIYGLEKDNKWETSNGFNTTSYADGSALVAISLMSTSVAWDNVESWTVDQWYWSPDIKAILQDQVDSMTYDPTNSEDRYVAYRIHEGDGSYPPLGSSVPLRSPASYDVDPADAIELEVTYDPWGEVMVQGGFRCDNDGLRYYP